MTIVDLKLVRRINTVSVALALAFGGSLLTAAEPAYELLWGDTHLHSSFSVDAYVRGNRGHGPDVAYNFAKGEAVVAHNGETVKLSRPLDFIVLADHAEYLGVLNYLESEDITQDSADKIRQLARDLADPETSNLVFHRLMGDIRNQSRSIGYELAEKSMWERSINIAEAHNSPGQFTTLIGYEWSNMPKGNNLHRVVVFADGPSKVLEHRPISSLDSRNVEDLWAQLDNYKETTGGAALTIAHNGNLSNGLMFAARDQDGHPLSQHYLAQRAIWEPLYEITQTKGDSEAHPSLSPKDKYADFETWDKGNIEGTAAKEPWMLKHEYAREALKQGLKLRSTSKINPFQLGFVGGTDSHTSLSTTDETEYWGKFPSMEPNAARAFHQIFNKGVNNRAFNLRSEEYSASGLTAVWASSNTRQAIFKSLQNREVYATTGSRISLRFFVGSSFKDEDLSRSDLIELAYANGKPMGSIVEWSNLAPPRFLVLAQQDPQSAGLERIQVVKGWLDSLGTLHETIHDVKISKAEHVGSAALSAIWQDSDFSADEAAFYYVRVLQSPTPRWPVLDVERYGLTDKALNTPRLIQERAYSSPIWFYPTEIEP